MPEVCSETCEAVSLKRYSMLLSSPFFILASRNAFMTAGARAAILDLSVILEMKHKSKTDRA